MDFKKLILYAALAFVCLSLWQAWQKDYPYETTSQSQQQVAAPANNVSPSALVTKQSAIYKTAPSERLIHVTTDVLDLSIDTLGGNVVSAKLINYLQQLNEENNPFILLQDNPQQFFIAKSDVVTFNNENAAPIQYTALQHEYHLESANNSIQIVLKGVQTDNVGVTKVITLKRGSYLINQEFQLNNQGNKPWSGYIVSRLLQNKPPEKSSGMFGISSYDGASISDPANKLYEKVSYGEMQKSNLMRNATGGWIAIQQHYFLTALIPPRDQNNHYFTNYNGEYYSVGISSPSISIEPKQQHAAKINLYLGPEIAKILKQIAPGLDYTIDYGWLWYISSGIFLLLRAIYDIVGNWGWAIVLVTVLIKLLFYKLSSTSYYSMANMRKLQPRMQELKERYANDRQQLSLATMELYKKEKINPLGGCWPVLIQIPVFIALYWVLLESVELRHAPFMLWIKDLSAPDPYYVLPILMGVSMLVQQMLSPASPDPVQAKMMMLLPLLFTFLFLHFPSGLVLYWVVNNTISIIQQWYIMHKFELDDQKVKDRRR